jgi:hypothetical protein
LSVSALRQQAAALSRADQRLEARQRSSLDRISGNLLSENDWLDRVEALVDSARAGGISLDQIPAEAISLQAQAQQVETRLAQVEEQLALARGSFSP